MIGITNKYLPYGAVSNDPKLIVVHAMAEYINDGDKVYHATEWLDKLKLSAHMLIGPDGDTYRCREDNQGAYHARGYNTDSLGIEFLVKGTHNYESFLKAIKTDYITELQYGVGLNVIRRWIDKYHISDIKRHSDISPGRKVDPGPGFTWNQFVSDI